MHVRKKSYKALTNFNMVVYTHYELSQKAVTLFCYNLIYINNAIFFNVIFVV